MQQDYEYLLAIQETGSIKAAAASLHVTQPAVSIALKRLEDAYQVQFFDRQTRPFQTTAAGEIMLRYIARAKMEEARMQTELRDLADDESGTISIVTSHYMVQFLMPAVLAAYHEQFPNIRIELSDVGSPQANILFNEGKADVCISPIKIESKNVACWPIYQDSYLFCVPNRFLAEKDIVHYEGNIYGEHLGQHTPAFLDIGMLREIPFITLKSESGTYRNFKNMFDDAHMTPNIFLSVDQISTANALANSGLGATLTSKPLVWYTMISDKVTYFRYDSPRMKRSYYLMINRERYASKAVKRFITVCEQHAKEAPWYQHKQNLYSER